MRLITAWTRYWITFVPRPIVWWSESGCLCIVVYQFTSHAGRLWTGPPGVVTGVGRAYMASEDPCYHVYRSIMHVHANGPFNQTVRYLCSPNDRLTGDGSKLYSHLQPLMRPCWYFKIINCYYIIMMTRNVFVWPHAYNSSFPFI